MKRIHTPFWEIADKAAIQIAYNPLMATPDQEQKIIAALIGLGEFETEQSLKTEGILKIKALLNCQADEAENVLSRLQDRKLIEPDITRGGALDVRKPMPVARWLWRRL